MATERISHANERDKNFREIVMEFLFMEIPGNYSPLDMIYLPGGTFTMGSPPTENGRDDDEGPQHDVTVPPFHISQYAVTQAQWRGVTALPRVNQELALNPSDYEGDNRPVEKVSWHDAVEFCQRLSRATELNYRLPSEAEWEYACRAGTITAFHCGKRITRENANLDSAGTTNVGSYPPNPWGLYDMHGNVWEWCADVWHDNYEGAPTDGSAWLIGGNQRFRVLRGGSWLVNDLNVRSANRSRILQAVRYSFIGFRLVLSF